MDTFAKWELVQFVDGHKEIKKKTHNTDHYGNMTDQYDNLWYEFVWVVEDEETSRQGRDYKVLTGVSDAVKKYMTYLARISAKKCILDNVLEDGVGQFGLRGQCVMKLQKIS